MSQATDERRGQPDPPWVALDLSPEDPATQGAADAYITLSFLPFWTGLSPAEKARYLDEWDASPAWRAAISERYDHDGFDLEADAREAEAWRIACATAPGPKKGRWQFWKP